MVTEVSGEYKQTHSFRDYFRKTYVEPLMSALTDLSQEFDELTGGEPEPSRAYRYLRSVYSAKSDLDNAIDTYSEQFHNSNFAVLANRLVNERMRDKMGHELRTDRFSDVNVYDSYDKLFTEVMSTWKQDFSDPIFAMRAMPAFRHDIFQTDDNVYHYPEESSTLYVGNVVTDVNNQRWLALLNSNFSDMSNSDQFVYIPVVSKDGVDTLDFDNGLVVEHVYIFDEKVLNKVTFDFCLDSDEIKAVPLEEYSDEFVNWLKTTIGNVELIDSIPLEWDNFGWDQLESFAQGTDTSATVEPKPANPSQLDVAVFDAEPVSVDKSLESDQFGE